MKNTLRSFVFVMVGSAFAAGCQQDGVASNASKLEGAWLVVDGVDQPTGERWLFAGDECTVTGGEASETTDPTFAFELTETRFVGDHFAPSAKYHYVLDQTYRLYGEGTRLAIGSFVRVDGSVGAVTGEWTRTTRSHTYDDNGPLIADTEVTDSLTLRADQTFSTTIALSLFGPETRNGYYEVDAAARQILLIEGDIQRAHLERAADALVPVEVSFGSKRFRRE